ncbi:hypothetical protein G4X40_09130 [Rhodococcus sp. D2-41]|uniref:hypothetical protein n=1 Tax=Speluncibacter jeojiensis TaxID=2710754 RepID=UPI002410B56E|nr:hypothetical protein [Rhodococcus sp. D2-41]MDG3010314.1 hypothetical protein [Rhodococcus sp. D2-41]
MVTAITPVSASGSPLPELAGNGNKTARRFPRQPWCGPAAGHGNTRCTPPRRTPLTGDEVLDVLVARYGMAEAVDMLRNP